MIQTDGICLFSLGIFKIGTFNDLGSDPSENDKVYRMRHASMALRLETAILAPQCNNYKKPEKRQSYAIGLTKVTFLTSIEVRSKHTFTGSSP